MWDWCARQNNRIKHKNHKRRKCKKVSNFTLPRARTDVSHYQGTINWAEVAGSGIGFAMAKATEGTTYTDPTFSCVHRENILYLFVYLDNRNSDLFVRTSREHIILVFYLNNRNMAFELVTLAETTTTA